MTKIIYKVSNSNFPGIVYIGMSNKGLTGAQSTITQLKHTLKSTDFNPIYKPILSDKNYNIEIIEVVSDNDNIIDRKKHWEHHYYNKPPQPEPQPEPQLPLEEPQLPLEEPQPDPNDIINCLTEYIALERYNMAVCQAKIQMYSAKMVFVKEIGKEPYQR